MKKLSTLLISVGILSLTACNSGGGSSSGGGNTPIPPNPNVSPSPTPNPWPTVSPVLSGKLIFVTTNAFNGNLGGTSGADINCNNVGNQPRGTPTGTYKAWIRGNYAINAGESYVNVDNQVLGTGAAQTSVDDPGLSPAYPIQAQPGVFVWTGFNPGGMGWNCSDFTTAEQFTFGNIGYSYRANNGALADTPIACGSRNYLYCAQQ